MNARDAEEYTQALSLTGAGWWRQIALAKRLGVHKALGLSVEQWVKEKLGGYVKLDVAERKQAALELKANGYSNREAAQILGVDPKTLRNDREENSSLHSEKDNGNNGAGEENSAPMDAVAALAAVEGQPSAKTKFTGEVEWYTPPEYIALARAVLGEIDLDPASSDLAQQTVKAKAYFTKADDGLSKEWHGNVWLNPPYAKRHITDFVEKLVTEHQVGHTHQAIMLTHNSTDTTWFRHAAKHCSAICFTSGRINFIDKNGKTGSPSQGQAFFYFGNRPLQFIAAFETIGLMFIPASALVTGGRP
jgi:phage N-6-adenine-methyltransferase